MEPVRYAGSIDRPWPPGLDGWSAAPYEDEGARARASTLGALPAYHYVDELHPTGLYRFFAYETGAGDAAIAALKFTGTLGQTMTERHARGLGADQPPEPDPGYDPNPPAPPGGGGGSQNTGEPIPQDDDSCHYVPDASNSKAVAIAVSISYHNTPVAWTDQSVYETEIDGTKWVFPMWWGSGHKMVAAFRCAQKPGGPPPPPPPSGPSAKGSGIGAGGIIGLLLTAGTVIAVVAGKGAV